MLGVVLALQTGPAAPAVCDPQWFRPRLAWDSTDNRDSTVARLRRSARAAPRDGERWLEFGLYLTFTVSERRGVWRERIEAEDALDRARRLLRGDPRPVAALGVLWRKQSARVDARRAMQRALDLARRSGTALDPCFEAEIHYQMALIFRTWWDDWDGMVSMFGAVGTLKPCARPMVPRLDAPLEINCPEQFYDIMSHRADLTSMRHDDRDAMIESLEAAVAANAGHRDARRALLLALFELRDWDRFGRALDAGLAADPSDPWLPLWGATAAYARREVNGSDRFTHRALTLLLPDQRTELFSPIRIAPAPMADRWQADFDSVYWRAADPLFLTDVNERLLAHVARVTYASGKFDVPAYGTLGPDTDAGSLVIRYGHPWRRWLMSYNSAALGSTENARELVWAIDSLTPPLRLGRSLTMRRWRMGESSAPMLQALSVPERWDPKEAFDTFDSLPVQVARFEEAGNTVLDVYALWRNPHPDFPADTVQVGFFVHNEEMRALVDRRRTVLPGAESIPLRFRAPLAPAFYWYRVETLAGPGRAAGRVLGGLRAAPPAADSLRTSDLLLGRAGEEWPVVIPHRDSLRLEPLYDGQLTQGDSLVAYWETYGLSPDSTGAVSYRVSVEAREVDQGTVADLVARLGAALSLGRRTSVTVEWDVQAVAPDGVRRDVLVVGSHVWPGGSYVLRVRITEPTTGRTAATERRISKPAAP